MSETLLWEPWGQASEETWSDCVSVGWVDVKGLQSQLRWCKSDQQSCPWIVRPGSFLNTQSLTEFAPLLHSILMLPIVKEAEMSAATSTQCCFNLKRKDHTIWVKQKNSKINCTRGSSSAAYFSHCPFNHKCIQFSLNLVDGEPHLIGPEITFFYNWLRVQTWEHKLKSQTEGH